MTVQQRQYEPFTLFNVRIVDMRHLWTPSDTYKGQKQQKANYFAGFIVPKTQAHWMNEPALAGLVQALGKLYAGQGAQIVDWRIEDGDTPNAEGKSSDFAKGHWLFNGSSSNSINVELVQAGGALTKLQNKVGVKSGDYCMIGGSTAVSGQNNRAAKIYLNAVVFTAPGEEVVFANSVSGDELMQQAQRQGLQVAGFSGAPGGFVPQGGGFAQQHQPQGFHPGQAPQGQFPGAPQQQGGFGGQPQPGFTGPGAGGFVPMTANPAQSTVPNGGGFGGNAAFPSNQPQQGGFGGQPNPYGQPQGQFPGGGGFGQR